MSSVTCTHVVRRYGKVTAVDNVSIDIHNGELFFLLGPSGCGKTTLLRMIAGFGSPDSGDILFDNQSILATPPRRRNTVMVFQNYALWPHMTVAKNVAYGLEERGVPAQERRHRVTEALQAVRMEDYADRKPAQLSGGQQQRVALARALVVKPGVVLLDEPLSNLDARLRAEMRTEIRRIHEETGITMIYVTHDQKEALTMADRVAVMSMGRVEQIGKPREVYTNPCNRFVAAFLGDANFIPGTIRELRKSTAVVETAIGPMEGRFTDPALQTGARVDCVIRPEHVRISPATGAQTVPCEFLRTTFFGEMEETLLRVSSLILKSITTGSSQPAQPAPGARINATWSPENVLIIPAAPSGGAA